MSQEIKEKIIEMEKKKQRLEKKRDKTNSVYIRNNSIWKIIQAEFIIKDLEELLAK